MLFASVGRVVAKDFGFLIKLIQLQREALANNHACKYVMDPLANVSYWPLQIIIPTPNTIDIILLWIVLLFASGTVAIVFGFIFILLYSKRHYYLQEAPLQLFLDLFFILLYSPRHYYLQGFPLQMFLRWCFYYFIVNALTICKGPRCKWFYVYFVYYYIPNSLTICKRHRCN